MANFKHAYKFCSMLLRDYAADETCLDLSAADENKLCALLEGDCYTRVVVDTASGCEIVNVTCEDGVLKIQRGDEETTPQPWEKGALVYFDWTPQNNLDWWNCNQSEESENVPPIKSDEFDVLWDEDLQQWCIEPKDDDGLSGKSWDDGKNRFTVVNGKITCEAVPAAEQLTAGTFPNATVVVGDDCKIKSIQKGCNVIAQGCVDGCTCVKCSQEGN